MLSLTLKFSFREDGRNNSELETNATDRPVKDENQAVILDLELSARGGAMEREWGEGRVYQFSSTADTDWGDLPIRASSVVPLVYRIIGSVLAHQDAGLNLRVGKPFLQPLAAHQNNSEGTVFMPALAQTNILTAEVFNDRPV